MRVPCAVLCSAGLLMAMATAGSASAQSPGTTRVVRPALDQVVGNGKLHVLVRTRARVRVEIDGRRVNRYLRRTRRGYRGVVRLGLIGYAATTIVGWYLMGPRYETAYIAKTIEVGLIALLAIEIRRLDGSPDAIVRRALGDLVAAAQRVARGS